MSTISKRTAQIAQGQTGHCTLQEQDLKAPFNKAASSLNNSFHTEAFQNSVLRLQRAAEGILMATTLFRFPYSTQDGVNWPQRYQEFCDAKHNAIKSLCAHGRLPEAGAVIEEVKQTGKISVETLLDPHLNAKIDKLNLREIYELLAMPTGGLAQLEQHIVKTEVETAQNLRELPPRHIYKSTSKKKYSSQEPELDL